MKSASLERTLSSPNRDACQPRCARALRDASPSELAPAHGG